MLQGRREHLVAVGGAELGHVELLEWGSPSTAEAGIRVGEPTVPKRQHRAQVGHCGVEVIGA
jgi:hypothetical protein